MKILELKYFILLEEKSIAKKNTQSIKKKATTKNNEKNVLQYKKCFKIFNKNTFIKIHKEQFYVMF